MQPGGGKPSKSLDSKKLLFLGGAGLILVILIVVIASLLSSGGDSGTKQMVGLAQRQQEIARVADTGYTDISGQSVRNFTMASKLTMQSDETLLTNYLKQNGVKVSPKELARGANSSSDAAIENAKATGSVDDTVQKLLTEQLESYRATIQQIYGNSQNANTMALLNQLYTNADLLLQQAKQ